MDNVKEIRSAHFIGIGGAGMSGIALVLHERGCKVTGSDLKSSNYVRKLEDAGIEVHIGHEAPTIDAVAPEVVVISTAIPETNPELIRARELGIPIWPRAKMLSYLSLDTVTVAVAVTPSTYVPAVMVVVPRALTVTVVPLTVATSVLEDVYVTSVLAPETLWPV